MAELDLTPFGFTPTETAAYHALTELGPQTGYGLAGALSIARANAYQALRALVAKGAVTVTVERPERYRSLQPSALMALIARREAEKLDRLEAQLARAHGAGAPGTVPITGERTLVDLGMRTAARAGGPVACIAPARLLIALSPAWHKRVREKAETRLWCLSDTAAGPLPVELTGEVEVATVERHFGAPIFLLAAPEAALIAALPTTGPAGYWTSDPTISALVRALAEFLTAA